MRAGMLHCKKRAFSSPGVHAWGNGANGLYNLLQEVSLVLALAGHLIEDEEEALNGLKECSCASFPRRKHLG